MRLATIMAHPDDAELWAGGTIIKHVRRGDLVEALTFADAGSVRIHEATMGANELGAIVHVADRSLFSDRENIVKATTEFIVRFRPDIVITHWDQDTHHEHRLVQEVARQVSSQCRIDISIPKILFACDTYNSVGYSGPFHPSMYIDISAVLEKKIQALRKHESQPIDLWEAMARSLAALHGGRCGRPYAEAFFEVPILGNYHPAAYLPDIISEALTEEKAY